MARASGLRILGPNTLGVLVPAVRLDTLFVVRERAPRPGPGPMAFISQSGATAVTRMSAAAGEGIGFHCFVGLGNRVDIDENELMSYLAAQSDVAWALACSPPPRGDRVAVLHAEPGVDAILCSVQLEPPGLDGRLLDVVIAFARASTRPVIVTSIGGQASAEARRILNAVRGAIEAGLDFAAAYPGTPSSEIGELLARLGAVGGPAFEWAVNEKVAFEMAAAAAACGLRTLTAMKHVGLNVAASCSRFTRLTPMNWSSSSGALPIAHARYPIADLKGRGYDGSDPGYWVNGSRWFRVDAFVLSLARHRRVRQARPSSCHRGGQG